MHLSMCAVHLVHWGRYLWAQVPAEANFKCCSFRQVRAVKVRYLVASGLLGGVHTLGGRLSIRSLLLVLVVLMLSNTGASQDANSCRKALACQQNILAGHHLCLNSIALCSYDNRANEAVRCTGKADELT